MPSSFPQRHTLPAEVSTEVSGKFFPPGLTEVRRWVIGHRPFIRHTETPKSPKRQTKPIQFQCTAGQTGDHGGASSCSSTAQLLSFGVRELEDDAVLDCWGTLGSQHAGTSPRHKEHPHQQLKQPSPRRVFLWWKPGCTGPVPCSWCPQTLGAMGS